MRETRLEKLYQALYRAEENQAYRSGAMRFYSGNTRPPPNCETLDFCFGRVTVF